MKKTLIFLAMVALSVIGYGIATQKSSMIYPGYALMLTIGILSTIQKPRMTREHN